MTTKQKRSVLITGCSDGGLGSHLALAFHEAGWRVFATARNLAKLKDVKEAGIETLQLDTVSSSSIETCVSEVSKLTGGSLDMLLNNAGAGYSMPLLDLDLDRTRALFELNTFSLITVTRAFLPLLRQSTTTNGGLRGGMIVNNTSVASQVCATAPFQSVYNASKAAAASFTEAMRIELAPFGIKVVNLITGSVSSKFFDNKPSDVLPEDSIYNVAKEAIEKTMGGADLVAQAQEPNKWAKGVVAKLSKSNPSHWIWSGSFSTLVRVSTHLPIGTMDSMMKSMTGIDVLEQKVKEKEKESKSKTV